MRNFLNVGFFLYFTIGAFQKVGVRIKMWEFKTPNQEIRRTLKLVQNSFCIQKSPPPPPFKSNDYSLAMFDKQSQNLIIL